MHQIMIESATMRYDKVSYRVGMPNMNKYRY